MSFLSFSQGFKTYVLACLMSIATKVYSKSYDYKFGIFVEIMPLLAPEYIFMYIAK